MNWNNENDIYSNFETTGHPVKIQQIDQSTTFHKEFRDTEIKLFLDDTYLQAWTINTSRHLSRKAILTYFRDNYKSNHLLLFFEPSMKDCQIALKSKSDFYIFDVDFTKPPSKLLEAFE